MLNYITLVILFVNLPVLLYLCVINYKILKYEIKIHEVELKLLDVSRSLERKL